MRPRPRIRKTIKWGGAAVTVLLVVVWIGSFYHNFFAVLPMHARATAQGGWLNVYGSPVRSEPGASNAASWGDHPDTGWEKPELWQVYIYGDVRHYWGVYAPLWMTVAPLLVTTVAAWRLDTLARRRARLNLCPKCSYDRAGIGAGAVCPECGERPTTS